MEAFFNEYLAYGLIGKWGYELGTVPFFLTAVACIIVPYLLGSINFAIIFSKLFHHGDVREHGSGNAGSTNMLRTYGLKTALLTFVCDLMKGVISALIGLFMMPYFTGFVYISGFACLIGHAFPIYYGFKGGKCVASLAGVMLVCNPPVFVLLFLVFVFTVLLSQYISLGSIICAMAFPLANLFIPFYVSPAPPVGIIVSLLMAILVVYLHRKNIVRLWQGNESKVSFRSKKSEKN